MEVRLQGLALTADRIFDGHHIHKNHALLIEGDRVVSLLPRSEIPADVKVIQSPGCTLLPGLIDAHVHFMRWQGPAFLAHGVTTVRDTGNDLPWILKRRREAATMPWPRIFSLGPLLDGPVPIHPRVARPCAGRADAVNAVRRTIAAGADGIKLYARLPVEWLRDMVKECHNQGRKASIHCGPYGLAACLKSKVDEFYHLDGVLADIWPARRPPGWLEVWGARGIKATRDRQRRLADSIRSAAITATPTLAFWESQRVIRTTRGHAARTLALTPSLITRWQSALPSPGACDQWRRAMESALFFLGLLIERDVPILAGTDVPCGAVAPGLSLWDEMRFLCEAGLSPMKAIQTATADTAAFLRRSDLGGLRPGSAADLVIVRGNPLQAIPRHPDIVNVIRAGVLYNPEALRKQVTETKEAKQVIADPWGLQFKQHYKNSLLSKIKS